MTEHPTDPVTDPTVESTDQDYGNLTVEDDPAGTTDPADVADTGSGQAEGLNPPSELADSEG